MIYGYVASFTSPKNLIKLIFLDQSNFLEIYMIENEIYEDENLEPHFLIES